MIVGIGVDLANIKRMERVLERYGTRFVRRVFREIEQEKADMRRMRGATYAKRWAAKEACVKALGTGLRMGIGWRDMWVENLPSGRPVMRLAGWAQKRLDDITPTGCRAKVDVSLTDDYPWAQAFVVIQALPSDGG